MLQLGPRAVGNKRQKGKSFLFILTHRAKINSKDFPILVQYSPNWEENLQSQVKREMSKVELFLTPNLYIMQQKL